MSRDALIIFAVIFIGFVMPAWLYTMYQIHPEYGFFITDDLIRRAFGG